MKNSKESLGYEIVEEFKEIKGRFNEKPWLLLYMFIACGMLWYIHIVTVSEVSEKGIIEILLVGTGMVSEGIGILLSLWYIIRKEKAGFSFALAMSLALISARACTISFPVIYHNVNAHAGMETNITFWCAAGALAFSIYDTIRFCFRYRNGAYARGAKRYSFSFGKKEIAVIAVVGISMFPIMFKGVRLTLHNTSIPQEVLQLYCAYLMSLAFCVFNRFSVKAFVNLVLYRRK